MIHIAETDKGNKYKATIIKKCIHYFGTSTFFMPGLMFVTAIFMKIQVCWDVTSYRKQLPVFGRSVMKTA